MEKNFENYQNKVIRLISEKILLNWGEPYKNAENFSSICSGSFISNEGHILTCAHCVDNSKTVFFEIPYNGEERHEAEIIFICPEFDIALLKTKTYKNQQFFKLMSNKEFYKLKSGTDVVSLGFPLGKNNLKTTAGIISGKDNGKIQTTSPLNPGNSGGPMVIGDKIIGINASGIPSASNIGFAVPISYYHAIKKSNAKLVKRPGLGIEFCKINKDYSKLYNIPNQSGILIKNIIPGSPGEKLGLKRGDIVYSIGNQKIDNYGLLERRWYNEKMTLMDYINTFSEGSKLELKWIRNNSNYKDTIDFITYPKSLERKYPLYDKSSDAYTVFGGLIVSELNLNNLAEIINSATKLNGDELVIDEPFYNYVSYLQLSKKNKKYLIITHIFPNSYISNINILNIGDIIIKVNDIEISDINQYNNALFKPLISKKIPYLKIETFDNKVVVMDLRILLNSEKTNSQIYKYPLADIYNKLCTKIDMKKKIKTKKKIKGNEKNSKKKQDGGVIKNIHNKKSIKSQTNVILNI